MLRFALILAALGSTYGQASYLGTQFVVMFMQNIVELPQNRPAEVHLTNDNIVTSTVSVTIPYYVSPYPSTYDACPPYQTVAVAASTSVRVLLCSQIRHSYNDGSKAWKSVYVNASSPISVIGYNGERYSADAFTVLPIASLGRTHLISSYAPPNIGTQFGVVANQDTNVAIFLGSSRPETTALDVNGCRLRNGDHIRFRLPRGQTLLAYSATDLTGALVTGDGPIAVFSGNVRAFVDNTRKSRDHLVEEIIPTPQLGVDYVFVPTPRTTSNDVVRILARFPGTVVTFVCSTSCPQPVTLQHAGDFTEQYLSEVTHIIGSRAISVYVIVRSQEGDTVGATDPADPSAYFIASIDQYSSANRVTPKFIYSITASVYARSYVLLSVKEGDQFGLRINGNAVSASWIKPTGAGALGYLATSVPISSDGGVVISHSTGAAFSAVVYAASDRESAATTLGLQFSNPCVETTQIVGDGIDNDCDGLVDEEVCANLIDEDGDLLVNEDCHKLFQSYGTDFALAFLSNDILDNNLATTEIELYITPIGSSNANVSVTSPRQLTSGVPVVDFNLVATAGAVTRVPIDISMRLGIESDFGGSRLTNKGIHVHADRAIVVYGVNKRTFSTDSFICFPYLTPGEIYYAATNVPFSLVDDRAVVGIVSHDDNNVVQLTIRSGVSFNFSSIPLTVVGPTSVNITINAFQAVEIQSAQDLTGTRIVSLSNMDISVFSGNIRARFPSSATSRDHIVEQMPPVSIYGKSFSSKSTPRSNPIGDVWKFVASQPSTTVTYWYGAISSSVLLVNAGDFASVDPGSAVTIHIESNKPVLVTQLVKSSTSATLDRTDPALIVVPAVPQWTTNYTFVTPLSEQRDLSGASMPYNNSAVIVVDQAYQAGVILVNPDNSLRNLGLESGWASVPHTTHVALTAFIQNGRNHIYHSHPAATFMGIMFGTADRESYGNTMGLSLSPACDLSLATMFPGDLIDNDCDGLIDEEPVDGIDNDLDGRIDEDLYVIPPLTVRYLALYEANIVEYPRLYALELNVGNDGASTAFCNVWTPDAAAVDYNLTIVIAPGKVKELAFSPILRTSGSIRSYNSFIIDCSSSVTIIGLNKETFSDDGFIAYPVSALGRRYYTVSYAPQQLQTQFAVVAAEPGLTVVTIRLPSGGASVTYGGVVYTNGATFSLPLNQFQIFQAQSNGDLTGTYITSDQKIAVFSGNVRTSVKMVDSDSRDHLVYEMPPTDSWGTSFALVPSPSRTVGDLYRVVSNSNGNTFTLCCNPSASSTTFSLNAGAWQELDIPSNAYCYLTSSQPALVAKIMKSQRGAAATELGDPCMTLVVPVTQYGKTSTLTTPLYTGGVSTYPVFYTNYLTVIAAQGSQNGVQINGLPLSSYPPASGSSVTWTSIPCSTLVTATVIINADRFGFQVTNAVPFSGHLAGSADRESYCVSIAQVLPRVN